MQCVTCRLRIQSPEDMSSRGVLCERCASGRTGETGPALLQLLVLLTNFGLTAAAPPLLRGTSEV